MLGRLAYPEILTFVGPSSLYVYSVCFVLVLFLLAILFSAGLCIRRNVIHSAHAAVRLLSYASKALTRRARTVLDTVCMSVLRHVSSIVQPCSYKVLTLTLVSDCTAVSVH